MTVTDDTAPAFESHDHARCAGVSLDHALELVAEKGVRLTPVRRRVLEILLEDHRAMGAYDILERLAADGFSSQPPVAYRALDFLVEHGLAHRVSRLNAYAACMHAGTDHEPAFFICEACQIVAEAPQDALRAPLDALAEGIGFAVSRSSMEIVGLCPKCR